MTPVAKFWLGLIRSPFRSAEFFRINRAQLGQLRQNEKDELWAKLTEAEKTQIKDALREPDDIMERML